MKIEIDNKTYNLIKTESHFIVLGPNDEVIYRAKKRRVNKNEDKSQILQPKNDPQ